jgi:hypothetical protein
MRQQKRHILLLLDNFSGHTIHYQPTHIQIEFFEPNMTSFVQPLDAGIIQCFKAHYRRAMCIRTLDKDEADKREIYKVDLLEAMLMAKEAWAVVSVQTNKNCWKHTGILPAATATPSTPSTTPSQCTSSSCASSTSLAVSAAWRAMQNFATTMVMNLPQAEAAVASCLGDHPCPSEIQIALNIINDNEDNKNITEVLKKVHELERTSNGHPPASVTPPAPSTSTTAVTTKATRSHAINDETKAIEADLLDCIENLKSNQRIIRSALTLEEMLNPIAEREIGESAYRFEGDDEHILEQIADLVKEKEMEANREEMEVDSNEDDEDLSPDSMPLKEMAELC